MDDDKIRFDGYASGEIAVHRLTGRMPELQRRYGLWIINCSVAGSSSAGSFRNCPVRLFEFYSLSHLISGGGRGWIENGRETDLTPGQAVVIAPGDRNRYGGSDTLPYVEDAVRFCGPAADIMRNAGVISSGIYNLGGVRRLLPLIELAQDPSADAQINANIALQKLLVDLYNEHRRRNTLTPMEELVAEIKSRPDHWWTVEELAEFCNLSTDQLRRNFLRHTGMRPKRYLEELKLRQAAELLVSSLLPIAVVAAKFGYADPYHFSRRFKNLTGVSPERYRREYPGGLADTNQLPSMNSHSPAS